VYKNYCEKINLPPTRTLPLGTKVIPTLYTQEEFINKIKTDDEFAKKWGDLGPIYGKQWRKWDSNKNLKVLGNGYTQPFILGWELKKDEYGNTIDDRQQIDQIQNLINDLKTNPDSRRLLVSAWNPADLPVTDYRTDDELYQDYLRKNS
jgi:thymidylate synthase